MLVLRHSTQTGFVHQADGIPMYENLCFVLSLFRSHRVVRIKEGKGLLKRMVEFFARGFPFHLHDYPILAPPSYQIRCAMPIYWMIKLYAPILEVSLRREIVAIYQTLTSQISKTLSPLYRIVLLALQKKELPSYTPHFSHEWGLLLASYQIAGEKPAWILEGALSNWSVELMTYSGPAFQEYQQKSQPEVTLYDLFMAEYQKKEISCLKPFLSMQHSLVFPYKVRLSYTSPPTLQTARYCKKWDLKGFHSMRLLWGSHHNVRSLVCQHPLFLKREKEWFLFRYPRDIPHEKERLELAFFVSYGEDVRLLVEQRTQTVFYLGETIAIHTPEKIIKLCFSLKEGKGRLMGHISLGNRPSQIGIEKRDDFASYDWKIGLRSISRSCDLTVGLRVF